MKRALGWPARWWLIHGRPDRGKSLMMRILRRLPPEAADFKVAATGGGRIWARLTESTGLALARGAQIERAEIAFAVAQLRPGDTAIDAGANVGLFTVPAGRAVGGAGRVVAIEPIPSTAARLRRSIALNRLGNVSVHAVALSDAERHVALHLAPDSAYSGIAFDPRSPSTATVTVPARTLDSVWRQEGSPDVRLLKLDIEGSELLALAGATELLAACRPLIVLEAAGSALEPLSRLLESRGYVLATPPDFLQFNHLFRPRADAAG